MKTQGYIDIECPIQEVFDYTIHNIVEWSSFVVEDVIIQETPNLIGSTFKNVTEERGRRMEFLGTVVEHDPPNNHRVHMEGKQFNMDIHYGFEELPESKTRVTQIAQVTPKGFSKIMVLIFGLFAKKAGCDALDKELNRLKSNLESS